MTRIEDPHLHDLPETRGMTAREALARAAALAFLGGYRVDTGPDEQTMQKADWMIASLAQYGFQVLPVKEVSDGW
jgi:hypothetical protein